MAQYLSKDQVKQLIDNRPAGTEPADIVKGLVGRGYELEGYQSPTQQIGQVAGKALATMSPPNLITAAAKGVTDLAKWGKETGTQVSMQPAEINPTARTPFDVNVGKTSLAMIGGLPLQLYGQSGLPGAEAVQKGAVEPLTDIFAQGSANARAAVGQGILEQEKPLEERAVDVLQQAGSGMKDFFTGIINYPIAMVKDPLAIYDMVQNGLKNGFVWDDQQKVNTPVNEAINKIIGGGLQISTAPINLEPALKGLMGAPFAGLDGVVSQTLTTRGIDPNSSQGKNIRDSLMNAVGLGMIVKGMIKKGWLGVDESGNPIQPSYEGAKQAIQETFKGLPEVPGQISQAIEASKIAHLQSKALNDLKSLENKNAKLRKVANTAERFGQDPKKAIIESNLLKDSVDKDGRIRTVGKDGPLETLNEFKKPMDKIVYDALKKEGTMVNLTQLEQALNDNLSKQLFGVEELAKATQANKSWIDSLKSKADAEGNILLSDIQLEKASKGLYADYSNPLSNKIAKSQVNAAKTVIENNATGFEVKAINAELAKLYTMEEYLQAMDGAVVRGGVLGKLGSKFLGGALGAYLGPVGLMIGQELGGQIASAKLQSTFAQPGGANLQMSPEMQSLIESTKKSEALLRKITTPPEASVTTTPAPTMTETPIEPKAPITSKKSIKSNK